MTTPSRATTEGVVTRESDCEWLDYWKFALVETSLRIVES
jgi:hypothetical protein